MLVLLSLLLLSALAVVAAVPVDPAAGCRQPFLWPFAADSVWNTPIGSGAVYEAANIYNESSPTRDRAPPTNFHSDQDWIVQAAATDPLTKWINDAGQFPGLCAAKQSKGRPAAPPIRFPAALVTDCVGNNNAAAVLKPDNRTLLQMQPLYRPKAGGPLIAWWHAGAPQDFPWEIDIRSGDTPTLQSALGSHGGSGLSGVGGTIRLGELLPDAPPIAHALKIELWSGPYYFGGNGSGVPSLQNGSCAAWSPPYAKGGSDCVPSGGRNQYVWPAIGSDSGSQRGGTLYRGSNPHLAPGALLALPPSLAASLTTTTAVGARIKQALTDYGGYIVDDTGGKAGGAALCMEPGVSTEVAKAYGPQQDFHIQKQVKPVRWHISAPAIFLCTTIALSCMAATHAGYCVAAACRRLNMQETPLYADLLAIYRGLAIVTNNGPGSVGGGGTPRRPAPPPFCESS
eukprot:SAG11_NODE_4085_length_2073_cov_2.103343_1_plen_456_part_00